MSKKTPRSGLPVPTASKYSPGNAKSTLSKGGPQTRSAEDISGRRVQLSLAGSPSPRRAMSPGGAHRRGMSPGSASAPGQSGVRYITEELIRKMCREDNLEVVTTLNLTLTKAEAGKKIKYIENLDKLKRLQVLSLSNNIIEKIERVDKLLKLKELDLSTNCIVKIEGLENLTNLQILNLSNNLIEHIPVWMAKRLKALRAFHIGGNRLESLSELAKLKPLPDLTTLTVAENPLAEFNHCRSYLVFHLRTVEIIDGQTVSDRERSSARDRFELDEVERLEKQLESEEARFRRLEEDHNRSKQERSHLSATEDDLRKREKGYNKRMEELEKELETKNDLLRKKTGELNKACEKHYALEQELAFYKIDSKFDSLGRGPEQSLDETGDDSGLLGESPYIGRARYKANRLANESSIPGASPGQVVVHSLPSPVRADVKLDMNQKLDTEIAQKKDKVAKAEDRLKRLTSELHKTEEKLKNATKDLKNIGDSALQEKEEQKTQIRQKLARKMRTVNEMKDSATQIEEECEKTKRAMHQHKMEMVKMKDQLGRMDKRDPNYRAVAAQMSDKEQQINESNQMYGQLQGQLELMLDTIAKETNDIKRLEHQLNEDQIENNDSLREELDDIVSGLQTYLAQVQTKAAKKEKDFDVLLKEKEGLQDKVRKMEREMGVIDADASNYKQRFDELEEQVRVQEQRNRQLEDQIHHSRRKDAEAQDHMDSKELEIASLKKALKDFEGKAKDPEFIPKIWGNNSSIDGGSPTSVKEIKGGEIIIQSVSGTVESGLVYSQTYSQQNTTTKHNMIQEQEMMVAQSTSAVECGIPGIIPHNQVDKLFTKEELKAASSQSKPTGQTIEKQLQTEKAKAVEGERKVKEAQRKDEEIRKLMSQLETVKAQNVAMKDRMEQDTQTLQTMKQETTANTDLRRRMRELSQNLKQGKVQIEPENDKDFVGKTFKDIQGFVQDKMNKSMRESDQTKTRLDKSDMENQSLREQLKRLEDKLNKRDDKVKNEKNKAKEEKKADQEEIRRLNEELQRLKNALKEAKNRSKQGKGHTKIVHDPETGSEFSRRSSLNSEEKHLFDELQNELLHLKRVMRHKEDDATKKLIDAETEAAMLEQTLQDQEESYQKEIDALREHMEMQKDRQEARMQVIAADLDQAQQVADFLQRTLDNREQLLHTELQQSDMNNQMITTQEDELAKLYDILETQKGEIGRLNGMLDGISGQGTSLGTAGADEELWRLRQEVNNLKETLAMQSAYVQTMPPTSSSAGIQATGTGTQYFITDHGQAAGPVYRPILSQYKEPVQSMVPPVPGMTSMGTSYGPPGYGRTSMGVGGSGPAGAWDTDMGPAASAGDQQGARTPPGGRPAGRSRPSQSSQSPSRRHAERGMDTEVDGVSEHSRRSGRSRRREKGRGRESRGVAADQDTEKKTAFEPVHRPQPYKPQMASGPVNVYSSPDGQVVGSGGQMMGPGGQMVGPGQMGPGVQMVGPGQMGPGGQMVGPGQMGPGGQMVGSGGQMMGPGGQMVGPGGQMVGPGGQMIGPGGQMVGPGGQISGYGQLSSQAGPMTGSVPVGTMSGAPGQPSSILKHPGIAPVSGPAGTAPHGYMIPPGYTVPPRPGTTSAAAPGYSQTAATTGTQAAGYTTIPTHPQGPSVAVGGTPGQGNVAFTGPAQALAYTADKVYLPAYPTSPSRPPARVYYNRASGPGGGGGDGGGGGFPGQAGYDRSPERHVQYLPLAPLAEGTPIAGHSMPRTSATAPIPSPIRAAPRDASPTRGRTAGMAQVPTAGNDDTYLFCNVPEHHDLEDYIAELQEKLKKLKSRIAHEKNIQADLQEKGDYDLIKRLQGELSERRDELEGLDLAIERQKKNLNNLKAEERALNFERLNAKEELEFQRDLNLKKKKKMRMYAEDEETFDERMENSRKKMIKDEIKCLEHTLAKRKAQLREADRMLKECNTDLKYARDEARETVKEYDKASVGLETTVKEASELEKRANIAGLELVKATEKLAAVRRDTKDYESKRAKQEKLLRDVSSLISKRDAEFKDIDGRSKTTLQNLTRLQNELSAATQKERDTVAALRDSEDILAKRRNEINRMRDQIDQQKHELEKVDHLMGKKRTELQFLTENLERKQSEINQLIRDTESELSGNKREIKEQRDMMRSLEVQKGDLNSHLKSKRTELQKLKDDIETEDEVLQKLVNSVNKYKSDLKHTFEMQRLEQTELDNLKTQHAQKLADLEKTQRELLDEKNALEQMNSDVNKKATELERLRGLIERDRDESERLSMEKQSYEDRIATMSREKDMLDETYKTLDTKIIHMRRSHTTMEEKIDSTTRRLQTLETEQQRRERELADMDRQKENVHKDIQALKNTLKEGKNELKLIKEQIRDGENKIKHMEQELRDTNMQRDEAKLEMERLNEAIRQSRLTHDDCLRQQHQREDELQDLIRTMDEREIEYQDTRKNLNKVRKEVEKEENKLSTLVSTASIELEHIQNDLNTKQSELSQATKDIHNLKREAEKMELDEHKLSEFEHKIKDLKQEIQDRNEEKNELAKALTRSYEELQKLRTDSAQEQERLTIERVQLENSLQDMQNQLEQAKKEIQQMQKRYSSQVTELQALAEDHFNRANLLSDELHRFKTKKKRDPSPSLSDKTNQNTEDKSTDQLELTKPAISHMSRDRGQTPLASPPHKQSAFRNYLNIADSLEQDNSFHLEDTSIIVLDTSGEESNHGLSHPNQSPKKTQTGQDNISPSFQPKKDSSALSKSEVSHNIKTDRGLSPPPVSRPASTVAEAGDSSSFTDVSSTITTPTPTFREPATPRLHAVPRISSSPPVRDAGHSVLDLPSSARDSRLKFDLGFLDILTLDSSSSVVDQCSTGRLTDRQIENKENIAHLAGQDSKTDILKEKLAKEQETLRLQLQQQMQRHADAMEQARLQSEGTIENLRKKLNTLQDVIVTSTEITSPTLRRARSRSAGLVPSPERRRSPSPGIRSHGYLAQRPRSRPTSTERLGSRLMSDREFLTV